MLGSAKKEAAVGPTATFWADGGRVIKVGKAKFLLRVFWGTAPNQPGTVRDPLGPAGGHLFERQALKSWPYIHIPSKWMAYGCKTNVE
jgi:hypothetical protein